MIYLEAPRYFSGGNIDWVSDADYARLTPSLFIGGTITGSWDWHSYFINLVRDYVHIFNPRRTDFDVNNPALSEEQILWEHNHLKHATQIAFWFSYETMAPITLFELGKMIGRYKTTKKIFIGCDPRYPRAFDVKYQTHLEYGDHLKIVDNLVELSNQVIEYNTHEIIHPNVTV